MVNQCVLTIATRNPHKTREIQEILGSEFLVRDLSTRSGIPDVAETGHTFEENAILKAVTVSQDVDGLVLADDSGLEVDVLDCAPGVLSARYAGEPCDDQRNLQEVLSELEQVDPKAHQRSGRFRCVLAIAENGELLTTFTGVVEGTISGPPRGSGGFGYDPIFVPQGFAQTFAELSPATKNSLSHRGRALAAALPFLRSRLNQRRLERP